MAEIKEFKNRMIKTAEVLSTQFDTVRAGRANAKVLDRITVEYYGSETPLNGVATISTPDARTLIIQPWDTKLLKDIQKAIQTSDLGINPQNDGRVIRLVFPQLTEERRKELTKQVKKYGEGGKALTRRIPASPSRTARTSPSRTPMFPAPPRAAVASPSTVISRWTVVLP